MAEATTIHDLKSLILSYHPIVVMETVEEERVRPLLIATATELKLPLFDWSITGGLFRHPLRADYAETEKPLSALQQIAKMDQQGIFHLKDFSTHLSDATVSRLFREISQEFSQSRSTFVLTGESVELPRELEQQAVHVRLELPSYEDLKLLVKTVVNSLREKLAFQIDLQREEAEELIRALSGLTLNQARQAIAYAIVEDGKLEADDIHKILKKKGEMIAASGVLEYFPVEDNHFELGGFKGLKSWLERAKLGFSDAARSLNLAPPRGVLIVGVQGCGKSLAAKYIAREWRLPLLKLDGGRLYDKYVGESEKNLRKATALAESMAPVVLWIDEIEKVFSNSDSGEMDGGLSKRLFATFLTWLQEKKPGVFVVGAANDLMSVPPELMRKGRYDEIFFVDLPDTEERKTIFEIHLKLRKQNAVSFDLNRLSEASVGFSGAEIEQGVVASLYRALHQKAALTTDLVLEELRGTVPLSVSRREDIERIREMARTRFVSVH